MFLDSKKKKISVWNRKSLRNWETETSRVDGRRIKIRSTLIEIASSFRLYIYIYIETILLKIIRNDRSKLHSKGSFVEKETNYVKSFIPLFRIAILLHLFWPSVFFILNSYHARLLKKTSRDKGYGWWKATNWAAEREIKIARVLQRRSHKFKYEQKEGFPLFFFLFFFLSSALLLTYSRLLEAWSQSKRGPEKWWLERDTSRETWKKTFQKWRSTKRNNIRNVKR